MSKGNEEILVPPGLSEEAQSAFITLVTIARADKEFANNQELFSGHFEDAVKDLSPHDKSVLSEAMIESTEFRPFKAFVDSKNKEYNDALIVDFTKEVNAEAANGPLLSEEEKTVLYDRAIIKINENVSQYLKIDTIPSVLKKLEGIAENAPEGPTSKALDDVIERLETTKTETEARVAACDSKPLAERLEYSRQYVEDCKLLGSHLESPKMLPILQLDEKLREIAAKSQVSSKDKTELKDRIDSVLKSEPGISVENKKLINKHMGAILREEMKAQGINVEVGWKQKLSDMFRGAQDKENAREALAKAGVDVKTLVGKMKAGMSESRGSSALPGAKPASKVTGRGA